MKKILAVLMAVCLMAMMMSCGGSQDTTTTASKTTEKAETSASEDTKETESQTESETASETEKESSSETGSEPADKTGDVMTYQEFMDAAVDDEVVIDCYVMAHQSWWQDTVNVYAFDEDGAYFIYNLASSEEDAEKLTEGVKIRVTGYKGEWAGEVEIVDGTFEFLDEAPGYNYGIDLTDVFGTDDLISYMNNRFCVSGVTVAPSSDADGNEVAFLYNWDGSGSQGDDLYFNVDIGGEVYSFTVESYLCGKDTDVYKAVEALEVGDVIDAEGYLYWYNGPNPHITGVFAPEADEGQMTYLDYMAADIDVEVTMKLYVQDTQSWWNDTITVYAATRNGGVFIYGMACSEDDAKKLVPGTEIIVDGYKSEWAGEVEIVDAKFEFGSDTTYIADAVDLTGLFAEDKADKIEGFMNRKFTVKDAEIAASQDADGKDVAYLYNWDGSGSQGDDLYFNIKVGDVQYSFTVESYLRGADTDVYKAVEGLSIGDKVDLTGFLYWYNGPNPHITECTPAE